MVNLATQQTILETIHKGKDIKYQDGLHMPHVQHVE